jgi:predicted site-specific integrase-resolvase
MGERLRTPEEVAVDLGGHISPHTIRGHVRSGHLACIKAARGKYLFTDEQVQALLGYLERPAKASTERATDSPFGSTGRSKSTRRKA